jgi:hypothetical protein
MSSDYISLKIQTSGSMILADPFWITTLIIAAGMTSTSITQVLGPKQQMGQSKIIHNEQNKNTMGDVILPVVACLGLLCLGAYIYRRHPNRKVERFDFRKIKKEQQN